MKEGTKVFGKKAKGNVYIENSKHERKATGSYYTPHYIVEYIVKHTVGTVLNERLEIIRLLLSKLDALYENQRKELKKPVKWNHWEHPGEPNGKYIIDIVQKEREIVETLFDIKVLDPAMGSGHFLVHTVDFITDRIISFLADYPDNPVIQKIAELKKEILEEIKRQGVRIDESKMTEVNLIKRMVMKRCIYGVDLNDMAVELAKLSLWLDSFTLGAPLSFLDHHLKCGNSLIGIFDISDVVLPGSEAYGKVQRALSFMLQVSDLTDATISEAQKSYDLFKNARIEIEPIRRRFDVATAKYFINLDTSYFSRVEQLAYTLNFDNESYPEIVELCKKALQVAMVKRCFHWRIEFPEVFYTERGEKDNSGFDCIIGNPPYINVEEVSSDEREFFMKTGLYLTTIKRMDIFIPFHELSIKLLKNNGRHSFIVPFPLLTQDYGQRLRLFFLNNTTIESIVDLSKHKIFPDATVRNIIPLFERKILEDYTIKIISQDEDPNEIKEIRGPIKFIDVSQFRDTYENMFRIDLTPELHKIQKKIDKKAIKFGKIFAASWGARGVPVEKFHLDSSINQLCKKMVKGINVDRYALLYSGKWLLYDTEKLYRPSMPEFFENSKIIFQKVSGQNGLLGVHDDQHFYTDDSLICCIPKYCFQGYSDKKLHKHKIYIYEDEIELSKNYRILFVLSVMNSKMNGFYFSRFVGYDLNVYPENIEYLPIPRISFTTPEQERKERVNEAIELYKNYMLDLKRGYLYEKTEATDKYDRSLEGEPDTGRKEETLSGKHPRTGKRIHGLRRRTRKPKDAERVSEDIERYPSTTRFIESSLGIKSYSELAPYLAKGVERAMSHLLQMKPDELTISSEFICKLHKDAFGELFPSWAGRYRDRNVTVSKHAPPPYFEVPVLMRQYCDDLESRLSIIGEKPPVTDILLETLSFAEGRLLSIHPFLDFNGRIARMLLFALLYRLDLPPVQLVPDEGNENEKAEYLNALSEADTFNWQPLMDIWRKRLGIAE